MRAGLAVAAGVALGAAIAACAAPQRAVVDKSARQTEITELWAQIRDWRREAHMELEPPTPLIMAMRDQTVRQAEAAACPDSHVPPPACTDVCDLADAICDNAASICGIAGEMPTDGWAQGKCDSAKASCKEAKQACCSCDDTPDAAEAP